MIENGFGRLYSPEEVVNILKDFEKKPPPRYDPKDEENYYRLVEEMLEGYDKVCNKFIQEIEDGRTKE
jgi:hypothetical protein